MHVKIMFFKNVYGNWYWFNVSNCDYSLKEKKKTIKTAETTRVFRVSKKKKKKRNGRSYGRYCCLVLVSVNTATQLFDWKCIIPNDNNTILL